MASRRDEERAYAQLKIMRLISESPEISTRQLAEEAGVSHGSAHYILAALVEKGWVKIQNFAKNPRKLSYTYFLTPKGIREKTKLTWKFIEQKRQEFVKLQDDIKSLENEIKKQSSGDDTTVPARYQS